MSDLNLNFLNDDYLKSKITYVDILNEFGEEICEYARGYFRHVVTTTSAESEVKSVSLYIFAIGLSFEVRIITIEIQNISSIRIFFAPINSENTSISINVIAGMDYVKEKISEFLSSKQANDTFRLIVNKINLKRKSDNINNN